MAAADAVGYDRQELMDACREGRCSCPGWADNPPAAGPADAEPVAPGGDERGVG